MRDAAGLQCRDEQKTVSPDSQKAPVPPDLHPGVAEASQQDARLAMETDERRFTNIGAAASGHQGSANITVLNR